MRKRACKIWQASITNDHLQVDGFASEEGSPQFNEDLSCARAKALASALMQAGLSSSQFDGATCMARHREAELIVAAPLLPSGWLRHLNPSLPLQQS